MIRHLLTKSNCFKLRKMSSVSQQDLTNFAKNGRKILGAGLNYNDILSIANVKKPEAPVLFLKPSTSYITEGQEIVLPKVLKNVGQEIELGVIIGKVCRDVSIEEAKDYIGGYCLGLDLTAFCELGPARKNGFPWSMAKGFDTSNPVSRFIHPNEINDCHDLNIWCRINGTLCQENNTKNLIYNVYELISYASQYMTLEPNDLIMTGTPKGATQLKSGDIIEGGLGNNLVTISFNVK